jgi:hypothetical protein
MQITSDKITEIFYLADEFCQEFSTYFEKHLIGNPPKKKPKMTDSEVITILVLFHLGGFRNLKHFIPALCSKALAKRLPQYGFL